MRCLPIGLVVAVAHVLVPPALPGLQSAAAPSRIIGTLVVAHGGGPEWNAGVETVVAQVRVSGPVAVSYLMGAGAANARFQDMVADLVRRGAGEVVVVPMLVSSHSGHYEQLRWLVGETDSLDAEMQHHLHMSGIERPTAAVPLRLARAIDDAPEAADVLVDRARALATEPQKQALFLVGHGPNSAEDYAAWMHHLRAVAERVREQAGFRSVRVGLVRDDAPKAVRSEAVDQVREVIQLQQELTGRDVVVVPVLIARGRVSRETIPADLKGLPIIYSGETLLPHAFMARWIESRVRQRTTVSVGTVAR
jgi:sirohydrochlorin cobaltochelatase